MKSMTIAVQVSAERGAMLPAEAMSLLLGVPTENILTRVSGSGGIVDFVLPPAWARNGRRRANEARAHTGKGDANSVLRYWAKTDQGADLHFTYVPGGVVA